MGGVAGSDSPRGSDHDGATINATQIVKLTGKTKDERLGYSTASSPNVASRLTFFQSLVGRKPVLRDPANNSQ